MKCARLNCWNSVTQKGQKYCSANCAPLARYGVKGSGSMKREESFTVERGDHYRELSRKGAYKQIDGTKNTIVIQPIRNESENNRGKDMQTIEPNTETNKNLSTIETHKLRTGSVQNERREILIVPKNELLGSEKETQLMDYIAPRVISEKEESQQMNLLDSTLSHLHGLMKQIAVENPPARTSPEMISAVCNCARNMRDLMKLKLDIVKAAGSMK